MKESNKSQTQILDATKLLSNSSLIILNISVYVYKFFTIFLLIDMRMV